MSRGSPRAPANSYFELKLNINTFCTLLHTLFGIKCGYYITLLRIRNCLDNVGVFNIREAYTPDICYRITWAIIDDGRSFFSHVMILQDFNTEAIMFPESLLDSILPDVRYANPIMRASFPKEWQPARQVPAGGHALATAYTAGSTGRVAAWTPPTGRPPPYPTAASPGGRNPDQHWDDPRHHKIIAMMSPYIEKFGSNVYVGELLDAGGMRMTGLPIPTGTRFASSDGTKTFLCWNAVLGRCKFGKGCKFKRNHPGKNELSDEFAEAVVSTLQAAVTKVVASKEVTNKRVKAEVITT